MVSTFSLVKEEVSGAEMEEEPTVDLLEHEQVIIKRINAVNINIKFLIFKIMLLKLRYVRYSYYHKKSVLSNSSEMQNIGNKCEKKRALYCFLKIKEYNLS